MAHPLTKKELQEVLRDWYKKIMEKIEDNSKSYGKEAKMICEDIKSLKYKINKDYFDSMKILLVKQKQLEKRIEELEKNLHKTFPN